MPNLYQGPGDARAGCQFGTYQPGWDPATPAVNSAHKVLGHISTLQRTSRAADGTPMHIRVDGPGFDAMDVPDGSMQPKLHFSALVPTADLFRRMRISQASLDLAQGVRRRARRPGPGDPHHRDPAAELPHAAAQAPGLPAAGAQRPAVVRPVDLPVLLPSGRGGRR